MRGHENPQLVYSVSSSVTADENDLFTRHFINCSSASNFALPDPVEGGWIFLCNHGSSALTVQVGGVTIAVLDQYNWTLVTCITDSNGDADWPGSSPVFTANGTIIQLSNILVDDDTVGLVLKSPDGHYWQFLADNTGAVTSSDLGTSRPTAAGTGAPA